MLSSNRPMEDWGKLLGDAAAVSAMLDRLLRHGHLLKCGPRSWLENQTGRARAIGQTRRAQRGSRRRIAARGLLAAWWTIAEHLLEADLWPGFDGSLLGNARHSRKKSRAVLLREVHAAQHFLKAGV